MQLQSLRITSCRSWPIADTASQAEITRLKKFELHAQLKAEGRAIGWPKAPCRGLTRYRQHGWPGLETRRCRPHTPVRGRPKPGFIGASPVTGSPVMRACRRNARWFLAYLPGSRPDELRAVQVDGASAWMSLSRSAKRWRPRSLSCRRGNPTGGGVERASGAMRYAFYPFYRGMNPGGKQAGTQGLSTLLQPHIDSTMAWD